MFTKLDSEVIGLLACPLCKSQPLRENDGFTCLACSTHFPLAEIQVGSQHREKVLDFRIHRPAYCRPVGVREWAERQHDFEEWSKGPVSLDRLQDHLDEIDSVREIYTEEFRLAGSVLDVGGHQGRLRHFLPDGRCSLYVSVDPFRGVFEGIEQQPNLLKAYPCLTQPCNFLLAEGESLPFANGSFDWVHMRSVVDHLSDPYIALKEAYRVLKPGGFVIIGLTIMERFQSSRGSPARRLKRILEQQGMVGVGKSLLRKATSTGTDHHTYRFTHAELRNLLSSTGFRLTKEHWQKPPFNCCIYITGQTGVFEGDVSLSGDFNLAQPGPGPHGLPAAPARPCVAHGAGGHWVPEREARG